MPHKKNGFWNLCFSMIPGAGQMYQGYMKRGVSIMTIFFSCLAVCVFLQMDEWLFLEPVIWFFGFFDSLHRNSLTDAERELLEDEYIFISKKEMNKVSLKGFRIPAAILLIFFGSFSLLQIAVDRLVDAGFLFWDSTIVIMVRYNLPKMVFSFVIIFLGIHLIMGKKEEIMGGDGKQEEEKLPWMVQYHKEENVMGQFDKEGKEDAQEQPDEGEEGVVEYSDKEEADVGGQSDKEKDEGEQA